MRRNGLEVGKCRPDVLLVMRAKVLDPHHCAGGNSQPPRTVIRPALGDLRLIATRQKRVAPPRRPHPDDPDVERERAPRLGSDDGAGRRPPAPPSTVRSTEPGADDGPWHTVEPSPTDVLGTPLAHAGHVTDQRVEDISGRSDRCGDIQVSFRHARKGTNRAGCLPLGDRVRDAAMTLSRGAYVPLPSGSSSTGPEATAPPRSASSPVDE